MSSITRSPPEAQQLISVEGFIKKSRDLIQDLLEKLVQDKEGLSKTLIAAARHSLLSGSKKIRPLLLLAAVQTFGGKVEKGLHTACAIEMIHTYSLIHDDLPCMDDDDFRRGQPSCHKAFTEAHAILAGDFLLTYAFEVIANDKQLSETQKVKLIALLTKNSGAEGMVMGQALDIEAEGKQIDLQALQTIHRYKTGALIAASVEMGGIIAGASDPELELLKKLGQDIGLAFQIADDILDVTSSYEKHGKAISSDISNDKVTYVRLMGIEKAREEALVLIERAKKHINQIQHDTSLLSNLVAHIIPLHE